MDYGYYLWAIALVLVSLSSWTMTVFGLPGNWLIVVAAAIFSHFFPENGQIGVSTTVVLALAILALVGEILEFVAGAAGLTRGGSKKGAIFGILGSFVGSLLGASIGIPIPVIGSLIGVVVFAALGAMLGTMLGERIQGVDSAKTLHIGKAAFWGRLFGTLAKVVIGSVMVAVVSVAALIG